MTKLSVSYLLWLFRPISCKHTICPQECKMHLQQLSQGRFSRKWNWKWISPKTQSFSFLEVRGFLHDHEKVYSFSHSFIRSLVRKYETLWNILQFHPHPSTLRVIHLIPNISANIGKKELRSVENTMWDCFPNRCRQRIFFNVLWALTLRDLSTKSNNFKWTR